MTERSIDRAACLALAERVERGESGREIDRAAVTAAGLDVRWNSMARRWFCEGDDVPAVSTDLTACEALRERLLPDSAIYSLSGSSAQWRCSIWTPAPGAHETVTAPTEPAARLAAILRAVAAQQEENTHA